MHPLVQRLVAAAVAVLSQNGRAFLVVRRPFEALAFVECMELGAARQQAGEMGIIGTVAARKR
jgi:hypothetical protein